MRYLKFARRGILLVCLGLTSIAAFAQTKRAPAPVPASPDTALLNRLEWRNIGPANMGGRTTDVEGVPGAPNLVYVGTASSGLWKTRNGGMSWTPLFDRQSTVSIGDLALDPKNPEVIYVGTGESNTRNSVSFGDGVYKSTDGGATWQHLGLKESERISRIVVNPINTDYVYVGALGHAFGPNEERGVYMSSDGGKTWQRTLFIDNKHGVADLEIDPRNPNILYAAMWHFERKPWTHESGSENGGVFKSVDAGRTWKKLTNGLPKLLGRIGIKVAPSSPNIVYAMTESKEGTLYRSDNYGETFKQVTKEARIVSRGFYYTDLRVDPTDENRVYAISSSLFVSIDGGKTFRRISGRTHSDYHTLWIDPQNPERIWQGQDGGIAVSNDRGATWEVVNNLALGQFYQIHLDQRLPFYYVSGGLQDNGTWTGPSRVRDGMGIMNDDWKMVSFGDGFHVVNHANHPELYLSESQGGSLYRTNMNTAEQQLTSAQPRRNDGGPAGVLPYRFNWNAPIVTSPHEENTVYFGGNVVFKSTDFGQTWNVISPDLTTNDATKLKDAGGPVWTENTTAEYHCTIISLSESPRQREQIWVGTDDGNLQMSNDGGKSWTNLTKNVGIAPFGEVSHVEPSRANAQVAYVAFDRHKLDDFRPYIFKTSDGGKTWTNIADNLPAKAYVWVVREDPKNTNLLYAGTELGLFASYNGGGNWIALQLKNLPTVAVHDIKIHPRDNDLVLATHGRSIWIFDDATPLQQMTPAIANSAAYLFEARPGLRFSSAFSRYGVGNKLFAAQNPPTGVLLTYFLKEKPQEKTVVKLQILEASGRVIREMAEIPKEKGMNRVVWNMRHDGATRRKPPSEEEREFAALTGGASGPQVLPGRYTAKLIVGDNLLERSLEVQLDPTLKVSLEDLQVQADMTLKLRDMQSATNEALKFLDATQEQLQATEKRVKEMMPLAPEELKQTLTTHLQKVDSLQNQLSRPDNVPSYMVGPRLSERLGDLLSNVDRLNAAPTPYQQEYFQQLEREFTTRLAEVNEFISQTVPQLNATLLKHNVATVMAGKAISNARLSVK